MNQSGRRNYRSVEWSGVFRKTDRLTWQTDRVFVDENCVVLQGLEMSGLEVRGQKIPTPTKENSTDFQVGTDGTKAGLRYCST